MFNGIAEIMFDLKELFDELEWFIGQDYKYSEIFEGRSIKIILQDIKELTRFINKSGRVSEYKYNK